MRRPDLGSLTIATARSHTLAHLVWQKLGKAAAFSGVRAEAEPQRRSYLIRYGVRSEDHLVNCGASLIEASDQEPG